MVTIREPLVAGYGAALLSGVPALVGIDRRGRGSPRLTGI